jgi:hypothetical protein
MRPLIVMLLLAAARPGAQENSLFGKKASAAQESTPATTTVTTVPAPAAPAPTDEQVDTSVSVSPFRPVRTTEAKETRMFSLAKLNRPLAFESTRELQRLFTAFTQQHVLESGGQSVVRAPGPITTIEYVVQQDLGEGRLFVKANWLASADGQLAGGSDAYAVLMPEKSVAVGEKGQALVTNVGQVAVRFTPTFAPLAGRRLTMRREAFIECSLLPDSPAGLQKFTEQVKSGAELSVITAEKFPCKPCGGLGFTREAQKGKLEDKRIPCTACESGKVTVRIETKFTP